MNFKHVPSEVRLTIKLDPAELACWLLNTLIDPTEVLPLEMLAHITR